MFIGSERCISTTLRRSKRRLQARRDKRLGRIADFLRLMTRAFKCSFSTTGKLEPIALCSSRRARGQNGAGPLMQVVKIVKSDEEGSAMSATNTDEFEDRLKALRPRLHRYCARMTGSAVNGEDVLQDALVKALHARAQGAGVDNLEGWLFRIAHNTSLDFLRDRSRNPVVPLTEDVEAAPIPEADIVAISFQTFLRLPELQRCAVILKDVLGHSVDEIASIAECSPIAAKSALQRGRAALRRLAQAREDTRVPLMSDSDRRKITAYVHLFRSGDFDAIRAMLADDVKLDLVNRLQLQGRDKID